MTNVDSGVGEAPGHFGDGQVVFVVETLTAVRGHQGVALQLHEAGGIQSGQGQQLVAAVRRRSSDGVGGIRGRRSLRGLVGDGGNRFHCSSRRMTLGRCGRRRALGGVVVDLARDDRDGHVLDSPRSGTIDAIGRGVESILDDA